MRHQQHGDVGVVIFGLSKVSERGVPRELALPLSLSTLAAGLRRPGFVACSPRPFDGHANLVLGGNCRGFGGGIEVGVRLVDLGNSCPGRSRRNQHRRKRPSWLPFTNLGAIHFPCTNVETGRLGCDDCANMLRSLINLARLNALVRAQCCGTTSEEDHREDQDDTVVYTRHRASPCRIMKSYARGGSAKAQTITSPLEVSFQQEVCQPHIWEFPRRSI